jgi:hypothetical protein
MMMFTVGGAINPFIFAAPTFAIRPLASNFIIRNHSLQFPSLHGTIAAGALSIISSSNA